MSAASVVGPGLALPPPAAARPDLRLVGLADDIATLADQFASVCHSAVDPLEIAAVLESNGFNDARAQAMSRPDVFAVADELWRATPRLPPPTITRHQFQVELSRHAVRGTLYLLPAVVGAALFSRDADVGGGPLILAALVVGWSVSQGVAYCAYVCLGRGRPAAAARVLLRALVVAVVATVGAAAVWTAVNPAALAAAWIAAAEVSYFLAATALFVSRRDRALLVTMTPLGVVCVATIASNRVPAAGLAMTAGVTLVAVASLAAAVTFRASRGGDARGAVSRADVVAAVPDAVLAAGLALWLVWSALDRVHAGAPGSAFLAPATIPVIAASVLAEWRISRYRAGIDELLRTSDVVERFRRLSTALLRRLLLGFAATLTVIALVVLAVSVLTAGPDGVVVLDHASMAVLGFVFFLSSLLAGFGSAGRAASIIIGTGAVAAAVQLVASPSRPSAIWLVYLVAGLVAIAALVHQAERRLRDPRSHR